LYPADGDIEAVVEPTTDRVRRQLGLNHPALQCLHTRGWVVSNRDGDGNVIFRRPAPPVPLRGSGAKGTHSKYAWKQHDAIRMWFDQVTNGKKKKTIGFKQLRAIAFARCPHTQHANPNLTRL
jgi:hypothetical protein